MSGKGKSFLKLFSLVLFSVCLIAVFAFPVDVKAAGWNYADQVTNFKVSPKTVTAGQYGTAQVEVSFDLKSVPEDGNRFSKYGIFMTDGAAGDVWGYANWPNVYFYGYELKLTGNTYTLNFSCDAETAGFTVAMSDYYTGYSYNGTPYESPVIKDTFSFSNTYSQETTDDWEITEMVSDMKLNNDTFSLGSEQNIVVTFNNKRRLSDNASAVYQDINFSVVDEMDNVITSKTVYSYNLNIGANSVELPCRFEERGQYYVRVDQAGFIEYKTFPIVVKKATAADGTLIDVKNSVAPQYPVYSKSQGSSLKIYYSIGDISADYHLYVREGTSSGYSSDKKYMLDNADFMSKLGELPLKLGETCELNIKTKFPHFGLYTVVLYNNSTQKKVAEEIFYVVPEEYLIQRDMSKMSDTGRVPFAFKADKANLDLAKDSKISMEVEFPLDYSEYLEEFKIRYFYNSDDDDLEYYDSSRDDFSSDNAFFSDDYDVCITVKYVPEYSKESRVLFTKKISGMYESHKVEITAAELMKAIYETSGDDVGYAGVVTVEFSNETGEGGYQTIANEAIVRFTESFSFGVSKSEALKSAKAKETKVERAYGETADFIVTDTLGGKIYATIYKGKTKVATVQGRCMLNEDGTATGIVSWDLKNKKGKYAAKGNFKAKIYTLNEYTVYDESGKASTKKIKSSVKTVKFSLAKPGRSLTLSASAAGTDGSSSVYIEEPVIGIRSDFNIGSKVTVKIKNSAGSVLKTGSYIRGKGEYTYWFDLSDLGSKLSAGNYKAEITAKTLDGASKSTTASFTVKKMPKPSVESASVAVDNNCGSGSVSFKVTQASDVSVTVKSGSTVKQTVIDQHYSAGTVKASFSVGGYAVGTYSVVITAKNSGGSATVTKTFEVKQKPVVVQKPTIGSINIRYGNGADGDTYKCSFNYTGKNTKVVIDVMYDDFEEIVYTYEGTTKSDSGTFTFTWDGFKSNGFKAWTGNYTMRVYLVNSAGKTNYVRKSFVIGEG